MPSDSTIRGNIYRALKVSGPLSLPTLQKRIGISNDLIRPVVLKEVQTGYLQLTPQGSVRILRPMTAPITILPEEEIYSLTKPPQDAEKPPAPLSRYENQYIYRFPPILQGDNPSCVGAAGAMHDTLTRAHLTGDLPAPGSQVQRGQYHQSGMFRYDRYFYPISSAWWIYLCARSIGNMGSTAGARGADAIEAMQQIGSLPWWSCLTPTSAPAPSFYSVNGPETFDTLSQTASSYRAETMIAGHGFESTCNILQQVGSAMVDIPVYESILKMGPDGYIPLPREGERQIGRHELLLWWFDRVRKTVGYRNSWAGLPQDGYMDAAYLDRLAGITFGKVDTREPYMPPDPVVAPPEQSVWSGGSLLDALKKKLGR